MMTQTHVLIAASVLASPKRPISHNFAIILGSFIPDLAVFGLFLWSKIVGISERELWREVYFSEPMLGYTAIGNSFPLYLLILLLGILFYKFQPYKNNSKELSLNMPMLMGSAICLFSMAAITHLLGDIPVHASDAHPHFWPFTDWRFHSPISYWDNKHHGDLFSLLEAVLGICLSVILFRRFISKWIRGLCVTAMFLYIAVPVYFYIQLS